MFFFETLELPDLLFVRLRLDSRDAHDLVATVPAAVLQTLRTDHCVSTRDHDDVNQVLAALETQVVLIPSCTR